MHINTSLNRIKHAYKPSTKLQPSEISISKKGKKYLIAERVNELDRKKLFNILKTL